MQLGPAVVLLSLSLSLSLTPDLLAQEPYRQPPAAIVQAVTAPPVPSVSLSPDSTHLLVRTRESMISIAVQARPILRLAGRRIDPGSRGPQRGRRTTGFALMNIETGTIRQIKLPAGPLLHHISTYITSLLHKKSKNDDKFSEQ